MTEVSNIERRNIIKKKPVTTMAAAGPQGVILKMTGKCCFFFFSTVPDLTCVVLAEPNKWLNKHIVIYITVNEASAEFVSCEIA